MQSSFAFSRSKTAETPFFAFICIDGSIRYSLHTSSYRFWREIAPNDIETHLRDVGCPSMSKLLDLFEESAEISIDPSSEFCTLAVLHNEASNGVKLKRIQEEEDLVMNSTILASFQAIMDKCEMTEEKNTKLRNELSSQLQAQSARNPMNRDKSGLRRKRPARSVVNPSFAIHKPKGGRILRPQ